MRPELLAKLTPVLTRRWLEPDAWRIETYERLDGYRALRKAPRGTIERQRVVWFMVALGCLFGGILDFLPFMGFDRGKEGHEDHAEEGFIGRATEELTRDFWGHICPIGISGAATSNTSAAAHEKTRTQARITRGTMVARSRAG